MPWKVTDVMNIRLEFVLRALHETGPFDELCQEYGISRKTGYKWKERFLSKGPAGLEDASRRPKHSPEQLVENVLCEIIRIKEDHKDWGPRKIREVYGRLHPNGVLPSESSFKRVLEKAGLVKKRRIRGSDSCGGLDNRFVPTQVNDLLTVDFKGWWYTGNRERCEPLTVRDEYSRFVLCATPLKDARGETVQREFERLFETYGLPKCIRCDNGSPFANPRSPFGLTKLSAWWISCGISLDRIPPGRPDQNGGHERMHRDIAIEIERCPETDLVAQRAALDTWRHTFNFERPHEAIGMRVPADIYKKSERVWTGEPDGIEYPADFLKRKVTTSGTIGVEGIRFRITTALAGREVGLKPCPDDAYVLWYGPTCLGTLNLQTHAFKRADCSDKPKKPRRRK